MTTTNKLTIVGEPVGDEFTRGVDDMPIESEQYVVPDMHPMSAVTTQLVLRSGPVQVASNFLTTTNRESNDDKPLEAFICVKHTERNMNGASVSKRGKRKCL